MKLSPRLVLVLKLLGGALVLILLSIGGYYFFFCRKTGGSKGKSGTSLNSDDQDNNSVEGSSGGGAGGGTGPNPKKGGKGKGEKGGNGEDESSTKLFDSSETSSIADEAAHEAFDQSKVEQTAADFEPFTSRALPKPVDSTRIWSAYRKAAKAYLANPTKKNQDLIDSAHINDCYKRYHNAEEIISALKNPKFKSLLNFDNTTAPGEDILNVLETTDFSLLDALPLSPAVKQKILHWKTSKDKYVHVHRWLKSNDGTNPPTFQLFDSSFDSLSSPVQNEVMQLFDGDWHERLEKVRELIDRDPSEMQSIYGDDFIGFSLLNSEINGAARYIIRRSLNPSTPISPAKFQEIFDSLKNFSAYVDYGYDSENQLESRESFLKSILSQIDYSMEGEFRSIWVNKKNNRSALLREHFMCSKRMLSSMENLMQLDSENSVDVKSHYERMFREGTTSVLDFLLIVTWKKVRGEAGADAEKARLDALEEAVNDYRQITGFYKVAPISITSAMSYLEDNFFAKEFPNPLSNNHPVIVKDSENNYLREHSALCHATLAPLLRKAVINGSAPIASKFLQMLNTIDKETTETEVTVEGKDLLLLDQTSQQKLHEMRMEGSIRFRDLAIYYDEELGERDCNFYPVIPPDSEGTLKRPTYFGNVLILHFDLGRRLVPPNKLVEDFRTGLSVRFLLSGFIHNQIVYVKRASGQWYQVTSSDVVKIEEADVLNTRVYEDAFTAYYYRAAN